MSKSEQSIGGRYTLGDRIGTGGYGEVFRAVDEMAGREVAIKLYDPVDTPVRAGAWREAAVLRRLNLPGVVQLLDEGIEGDQPFLVMPLVEGSHFPGPGADEGFPAAVVASIVEILTLVHAAGVVHGDLKPQNVLVDADGRVTLLDFGTGSWVSGMSAEEQLDKARGTPAYMAPEQLRGRPATVQSDYYALGVMLYQALTGVLPHPADSLKKLMRARLTNRAPVLDAEQLGISHKLARAVEGLLAPAPERRLQHLSELSEALDVDSVAVEAHSVPYLDPDGMVDMAVAAVERGESVDIVGRRGMGRTRCLEEIASRLRDDGRRVTSLVASQKAFDSLSPLVRDVDVDAQTSLDQARAAYHEQLIEALASGKVVVADNAEQLDRWTAALLDEVRDRGAVVRALLSNNRSDAVPGAKNRSDAVPG
ncbi:MAG: serine/threonine protein kinase, partial [Persicimonas sp.]